MRLHAAGIQLLLLKQVGLILAQVLPTGPVVRLMEMAGELLDDPDVGFYGTRSEGKDAKNAQPARKAQYNFTDPESRILKGSDGFVQGYNTQIAFEPAFQ
jgi:hypothetical protein